MSNGGGAAGWSATQHNIFGARSHAEPRGATRQRVSHRTHHEDIVCGLATLGKARPNTKGTLIANARHLGSARASITVGRRSTRERDPGQVLYILRFLLGIPSRNAYNILIMKILLLQLYIQCIVSRPMLHDDGRAAEQCIPECIHGRRPYVPSATPSSKGAVLHPFMRESVPSPGQDTILDLTRQFL